jgi:hypothetical protein
MVPFADVLAYLEAHGWNLVRIWRPYRVFTKPGRLPILVTVHEKMVQADDFEKIQRIVEADR